MIDTLHIYTHMFDVEKKNSLNLLPQTIMSHPISVDENPLIINAPDGSPIICEKGWANTDIWNITVRKNWINLYLSLPRVHTSSKDNPKGDNFYPVSRIEAIKALDRVVKQVRSYGVNFSLEDCLVSRLDLFKNIYTDAPFLEYAPILNALRAKRTKRKEYDTTFYWKNTRHEVCIYDKIAEIIYRGGNPSCYPLNVLRCEYKLLKNDKVREVLNIKNGSVVELFKRWDYLDDVFRDHLSNSIFCVPPETIEHLSGSDISSILRRYKENHGRNWLDYYLKHVGLEHLLDNHSFDDFVQAFEDIGVDRTKAYRMKKILESMQLTVRLNQDSKSGDLRTLYTELKDKILK